MRKWKLFVWFEDHSSLVLIQQDNLSLRL